MKITSELISLLGKLSGGGTPELGDPTIDIPPVALLSGWTPFIEQFPANAGATFARSFSRPDQITLTNGVGITSISFSLVPGIWRIRHTLHMEANFTNANPIALDFVLKWRIPAGVIENFVFTRAARNNSLTIELAPRIYCFDVGVQQIAQVGTNGVGQTTTLEVFTEGERLL